MRILKEETLAIAIDIQSRLFPYIQDTYNLQKSTVNLINGLKVLQIPLIVTEQYTKGLGETIIPVQKALGDLYEPIEKMSFSVADDEPTFEKIKSYNKKNIILFGIESHVCLLQSALDLKDKGFNVIVASDCIGSRNTNDKEIALKRYEKEDVILTTYESLLFELLRFSGTEEFKSISKIVK